jgi:hypothetical protein
MQSKKFWFQRFFKLCASSQGQCILIEGLSRISIMPTHKDNFQQKSIRLMNNFANI